MKPFTYVCSSILVNSVKKQEAYGSLTLFVFWIPIPIPKESTCYYEEPEVCRGSEP